MKFIDINCGSAHTILKSYKNEWFVMGSNNYSECLLANAYADDISIPTKICLNYLKRKMKLSMNYGKIIQLIPGYFETIIILQNFCPVE